MRKLKIILVMLVMVLTQFSCNYFDDQTKDTVKTGKFSTVALTKAILALSHDKRFHHFRFYYYQMNPTISPYILKGAACNDHDEPIVDNIILKPVAENEGKLKMKEGFIIITSTMMHDIPLNENSDYIMKPVPCLVQADYVSYDVYKTTDPVKVTTLNPSPPTPIPRFFDRLFHK